MKKIYIIGGGTFNYVRSHLSLAAPAFGETAISLKGIIDTELRSQNLQDQFTTELILTRMADPRNSKISTNQDVENTLTRLVADTATKAIIFNVALTDFEGQIGDVESGKLSERLETRAGKTSMQLTPSHKLIGMIRKTRKDIFAVGFKTTTNQSADTLYAKSLKLLKENSLNLVVGNDTGFYTNMIVAPEETRYCQTTDRGAVLNQLAAMMVSRMQNHFTRSTVISGDAVKWQGDLVPNSLRTVVNHCISKGAYKPVLGKTAGHFAVRVGDDEFLTSIRKSNFNNLNDVGLVKIVSKGEDEVIAHGFRPSVGGQSQRIIFREHPELDCIVHFHCPPKSHASVPTKEQWPNECGSHECGRATSRGLGEVDLGDGDTLKVVYLENHGPNIVFNQKVNPGKIIDFIDQNFSLMDKTGGLAALQ